MPTNRDAISKKVDAYATALLDGAYQAGLDAVLSSRQRTSESVQADAEISAKEAVLEVRGNLWRAIENIRNRGLELSEVLKRTPLTPEQRCELANIMTQDCHPVFRQVFSVMAERSEVNLLSRVRTAYEEKLEAKLNVAVVDVTTVVKLDDRLYDLIKNKAETELGMDVVIRERIDESLLGGITMKVRGRLIDASIATELERARYRLKKTRDGGEQ